MNRVTFPRKMVLLGENSPMTYTISSGQQQGITFLTLCFMLLLASKDNKSGKNYFLTCFTWKVTEGLRYFHPAMHVPDKSVFQVKLSEH